MSAHFSDFKRILVLSPHLDDAALSLGGAIDKAVKSGAEVVIATVFTADPPPLKTTSPIIDFLHGIWDRGSSPMAARRDEDAAAAAVLGARLIHGGLPDAIYRTDEAGTFFYPTRTAVFSSPVAADFIYPVLSKLLSEWLDEVRPDAVLCPLAVGRHVDHAIVSEVFRTLPGEARPPVFLYEDMPYSTGRFPPESPDTVEAALARTRWTTVETCSLEIDIDRKVESVLAYTSQIEELFPDAPQPAQHLKRLITPEPHQSPFFETIRRAVT